MAEFSGTTQMGEKVVLYLFKNFDPEGAYTYDAICVLISLSSSFFRLCDKYAL